jgi:predicted ribosomally synthesized peptide with nif11-like leader
MSKKTVDSFYERLSQDEKMHQEYTEALGRGLLEAAATFATTRGFELSPDEFSDALQSRSNGVSDDELDKVAGGVFNRSPVGLKSAAKGKVEHLGDMLAGILDLDKKGYKR